MEIIAKTTGGFLIQATGEEIKEILNSVTGSKPEKIEIGQKIPAIDYASTITKIKALNKQNDFERLIYYAEDFNKYVNTLKEVVGNCTKIEL